MVRRLVPFSDIARHVPPTELAKCKTLGSSCTAFFCGGCHAQRQLQVDYNGLALRRLRKQHEANLKAHERTLTQSSEPADAAGEAEASAPSDAADAERTSWQRAAGDVLTVLEQLKAGAVDASAAVAPLVRALGPTRARWQELMFEHVLPAVADPLTRASLTHAFLRELAEFRTPCCRKLQCASGRTVHKPAPAPPCRCSC
jgi:hypothetical protein